MRKFLSVLCTTLILSANLAQAGKIQNEDVKSLADLISAGTDGSHLINDTKVWISANGINQQLSAAIAAGLIGGGSGSGGGINTLQNPAAEVDLQHISSTIPADLIRTTTGSLVLFGQGSFGLLASAAEVVTWDAITVPNGLRGSNCAASLVYKGNASAYTLRVEDGSSNILASQVLGNATNPLTQLLSFTCPTSGTFKLQLATTGSGAQIYFDNALLGTSPLPQISQSSFLGSMAISGCSWDTTTVGTPVAFAATTGCTYTATGSLTAPGTQIPGFVLPSTGPGNILIIATGAFGSSSTGNNTESNFNFFDGSTNTNTATEGFTGSTAGSTTSESATLEGSFTYATGKTNTTYQIYGGVQNGQHTSAGSVNFDVYYYPTQQQAAFNAGQVANSWSGYVDACNWTLGGSFPQPFVFGGGACNLVQRTNTNFGTVTPWGGTGSSALPGIVFSPSRPGKYRITAKTSIFMGSNLQSAELSMSDGTTVIDSSPAFNAGNPTNTAGGQTGQSATLDGFYVATSTSPVTIQINGGSTGGLTLASQGLTSIEWSIMQIDQPFPAPVLVGGVVSPSTGVDNIVRFKVGDAFNQCAVDPCPTVTQGGTAVTVVNRTGIGSYTAHFAAGVFSAAPTCSIWPKRNSQVFLNPYFEVETTSTTLDWGTYNNSSVITDSAADIICIGPK